MKKNIECLSYRKLMSDNSKNQEHNSTIQVTLRNISARSYKGILEAEQQESHLFTQSCGHKYTTTRLLQYPFYLLRQPPNG